MYGDHSGEFVSGYWGLKLCANGCNNSQHCWPNNIGSCCICFHMAKSLTGFKLCTTTPDNTQQPATTCNRVFKQTQLVISNNGGSSWPKVLGPFFFWAWVLKGKDMMDTLLCPKEAQLNTVPALWYGHLDAMQMLSSVNLVSILLKNDFIEVPNRLWIDYYNFFKNRCSVNLIQIRMASSVWITWESSTALRSILK